MNLRRKVSAAAVLLLVCAVLLVSASYAWLVISRVPEVSGIGTNIGANGSLEIALLNDTTYTDPSLIRSSIGDSAVVVDPVISNQSWGNVIDLTGSSYGLSQISMLPARLNVSPSEDGRGVVGSNLLSVAQYGLDGRFSIASTNTVCAAYRDSRFVYSTSEPGHGVRGIGALNGMTQQQAALANSRAQVRSYTVAATGAAKSTWQANGSELLRICESYYGLGNGVFDNGDVAVIRDSASRLLNAFSYVDSALRQGIVGVAAATIDREEDFWQLRNTVENTRIPLSVIAESAPMELPYGFNEWITCLEEQKVELNRTILACDSLQGGTYGWAVISPLLNSLFDPEYAYLDQYKMNAGSAYQERSEDAALVLSMDCPGAMTDIARFVDSYEEAFTYLDGSYVTVTVMKPFADSSEPAYLDKLSFTLNGLDAASGGDVTLAQVDDVYGFAVDLALRCNENTDLLLQTEPKTRLEGTEGLAETQGGGSYMRFTSEQLSSDQVIRVMGAIRVAFLDNQGNLFSLAKLDTENCVEIDGGTEAPLYLYDFQLSPDGSISVGGQKKEDSTITQMTRNNPVIMTVVVWLDGDHVDNSMAAISGQSLTGLLNLQFASSVALNPAFSGGISGIVTPPASGGSEEPTPDTPVIPAEQTDFYLEHDGGNQYSFYTLNADGSRDYEMPFTGSMDAESGSVVVEEVTSYPAEGVVIPALATYAANDEAFAVSIDPTAPFADLGSENAAIFIVPVDGEKVGITSSELSYMFAQNSSTDFVSLDLSGLDTSNITDMSCMFRYCYSLKTLDVSGFDTSNVTDMSQMFYDCNSLTSLDLSGFDTSNVTDMGSMFSGCSGLTELDVSDFDTSSVTYMSFMFSGCSGLTELDVTGFDTSNVTYMSGVFDGCSGLTKLDVSGFDTANAVSMYNMFSGCSGLTELDVAGFDTAKVTNMRSMFDSCFGLTKLDVSGFDTAKVTDMYSMFYGCSGLTELDLSSFDTANATDMGLMLYRCSGLQTIMTPKAMGDAAIELPGSYVCQADGKTYTQLDNIVPTQTVLAKQQ